MRNSTKWAVGIAATGLVAGLALVLGVTAPRASEPVLKSAVVAHKRAKTESFAWGSLHTYFAGESYATRDGLAAVALVKPGMQIHPPHKHAEEEYLMVLEGTGTWSLNGKDFAAVSGDMLYASPWDVHGIKNTGQSPLKFVVWKWNGKKGWRPPVPAP